MKLPKNPKINHELTKQFREAMKHHKKVKITINIDADSLEELKARASKNENSYQNLLNKLLKEKLFETRDSDDRLDRLEKEVEKLKKKLAA